MRHALEPVRRRLRVPPLVWTVAAAAVAALVAAAVVHSGGAGLRVSADQRLVITKLESVLLHDTVVPQYDRVVNEFDGRGYVAGIGDFSTVDGGALQVVQTYSTRIGTNALATAYQATLTALAAGHSDDVSALAGFPGAWRAAALDPAFRQVQDDVLADRAYQPAYRLADTLGIRTALGLAIIYDSLLQHGSGRDPDGLPALVDRTIQRAGGRPGKVPEHQWLRTFLELRGDLLASPAQPEHAESWPYQLGRVDTLTALLTAGDDDLRPTLQISPYGTLHVLDLQPLEWQPNPAPTAEPGQPSAVPSGATSPDGGRSHGPGSPAPSGQPPASDLTSVRLSGPIVGIAGLCMDIDGAVAVAGNHIKTWSCNGTNAQHWLADRDGSLRALGMCLQIAGDSGQDGSAVEIDPCDGRQSQQWRFTGGHLVNPHTGLCLSVPGDATQPGTLLQVAYCGPEAGKQWKPPPPW
ncbi:MAG TPA: chitosanase [Rugosimonospora sp.]|nr:chitosanase [Rugosimonospora sp.]